MGIRDRLYADLIEQKQGRRPVVFLTNGFDVRICDNQYPERKIAAIYSKRDLEKLFNLRQMRSGLGQISIDKNIAGRYYQEAAIKAVCDLSLIHILTTMDAIYEQMEQIKSADTRGDVYEYLLSKLATAGVNGQFRTPRHIIRMMVEMMNPKANEIICDPACGTSGFLVAASEYQMCIRDRCSSPIGDGNDVSS